MKDALGHGSNGLHSGGVNALPNGGPISDANYHASMPIANYTGQVQDMLGMWAGTQKPASLTASETKQINDAYAQRADWRTLAHTIADQREKTDPNWERRT